MLEEIAHAIERTMADTAVEWIAELDPVGCQELCCQSLNVFAGYALAASTGFDMAER